MGSLGRSSVVCSFIQGLAVWSVVLADEQWTVTIPARMSAPIGSCMVIPCSFTRPPTGRSMNVIWYQYARFTYPLVYSKSNPSKVIDEFRGRTELIGSASEGNCSLKINQTQASQNAQKIYVRIEPNKLTSKTVTLEVTARAPQPEIQVNRTEDLSAGWSPTWLLKNHPSAQASIELTEGDEVTAICDVIHTCPPSPPSVSFRDHRPAPQWSHQEEGSGRWRVSVQMSWTASSRDHGRSVACDVTHPGGQTASGELVLKVTYPPKSVNVHGDRNVVPPGGNVSLSCKSQANPPADSFQWYRVLHGRPTLLDHTSQTVTITELDRDQNLFRCTANNSMGTGSSSVFEVIKEYKPSISADSLCSISGGFLSCGCEATARPVASLQWRVEGMVLDPNSLPPESSTISGLVVRGTWEGKGATEGLWVVCVSGNRHGLEERNLTVYVKVGHLGKGAIVFGVAGGAVALCLLLGAIFYYKRTKSRQCKHIPSTDLTLKEEKRVVEEEVNTDCLYENTGTVSPTYPPPEDAYELANAPRELKRQLDSDEPLYTNV